MDFHTILFFPHSYTHTTYVFEKLISGLGRYFKIIVVKLEVAFNQNRTWKVEDYFGRLIGTEYTGIPAAISISVHNNAQLVLARRN
jgi:hypothetical protein